MAKRKAATPAKYDDDYTAISSDSDNDHSYGTGNASSTKRQATRAKKRTRHHDAKDASPLDSTPSISAYKTHGKSLHIIQHSGPLRVALLRWYSQVQGLRKMPWRKTYDPRLGPLERSQRAYEVWTSEVMLQQTQVATVIPYYNIWMEKFPTLKDLAAASIEEVNAVWKGLGYYSRASRLLSGAKKVVEEYGGILPDNAQELENNIPGIGRYSAGAICSIAYGERVPVLDGNVHRLLSRILALYAPPKAKATLDILWSAATDIVAGDAAASDLPGDVDLMIENQYPGDINQALIELGSTICKVRLPQCEECPLRSWCAAYTGSGTTQTTSDPGDIEDCGLCHPLPEEHSAAVFPMKVDKKKVREETDLVSIVEWRSGAGSRHFLLVRRPEGGLLAGLWEFPTAENASKSLSSKKGYALSFKAFSDLVSDEIQHRETAMVDGSSFQLHVTRVIQIGEVLHLFSHIRKTYRVQWVILEGGQHPPALKNAPHCHDPELPLKMPHDKMPSVVHPHAQWTPMADVASSNIGTGVVKVWKLFQTSEHLTHEGDSRHSAPPL